MDFKSPQSFSFSCFPSVSLFRETLSFNNNKDNNFTEKSNQKTQLYWPIIFTFVALKFYASVSHPHPFSLNNTDEHTRAYFIKIRIKKTSGENGSENGKGTRKGEGL